MSKELTDEELDEQLRTAEDDVAKIEAKVSRRKKLARLERLELIKKFSEEYGEIDKDWIAIDCTMYGHGFVVCHLGPAVLFRNLQGRFEDEKNKATVMDVDLFVRKQLVQPSIEGWQALVNERERVAWSVAEALMELHGAKAERVSGK